MIYSEATIMELMTEIGNGQSQNHVQCREAMIGIVKGQHNINVGLKRQPMRGGSN